MIKYYLLFTLFVYLFIHTNATGAIGIGAIDEVIKYQYEIKFFDVPLDHFSYSTNKTFSIRYLINDTYVKNSKSPVLFYTGNEGDIELFAKNTGFIWDIAPELNALIIFAEHRYYGQSLPFGNQSYDNIQNLGYLSSEQALADFADLIQAYNFMGEQRPVIVFGGSYGGMLSAWIRMKYPHLVTGAIASSAPILQFPNITDCNVFSRIVTSVFSTAYNGHCTENIRKSWDILKNLATTSDGRNSLNTKFKFCANLTKPEDIQEFMDFLNDVYGNLAMVNYPYGTDFLAPLPAYPVRAFCRVLSEQFNETELLEKFQIALSIYTNYTGKLKCLDISSAYDSSMGAKGWDFQACTEMVMPMCSNGKTDMFPETVWNFNEYSDSCFNKFNVRPRPMNAITIYGGKRLQTATNIVFSNGLLDPWCGGGVLRNSNDKIKIIIIPEGAHHIDLRAAHEDDPESVKQARTTELDIIRKWINKFRQFHY